LSVSDGAVICTFHVVLGYNQSIMWQMIFFMKFVLYLLN